MKLSDELKSKNINFKNRIVMPPMATAKADKNGHVTEEILHYYEDKTKNKLFSTVIIEHCFVDVLGKASKNQTSIADDSTIDGMKKLANLVKSNDSNVILQISHAGSSANEEVIGQQPVAPSAIKNPSKSTTEIPRELTVEEIEQIIEKFVDAAVRSKKAGFDGVEIHSAHGYLLNQFLSPITNKRTDEYGGDIDGRIKIHLEIIRKIREKVGEDYPIFIRVGAGDYLDGGLSTDDSIYAAQEFVKAGVDVLDISGGMCMFSIDDQRAGFFDFLSKPIYENVDVPVILTGGVKTGDDVEDILNRGVCDLVGIGRSVFKDSNWIENEIKPLI
ncbi:NADH:flavin oxidoreductase [Finegoldia magna]|uniref:NADH:flavin oxidoreductase n=1 Tax=Finegoldia magna TaxID=1260 RepID=UPI0012B03466|nr:NADH:flavin oxidoreductase [Finegoldia magna]MSB17082.1 NADH:flavin oxidoreductase [Finegoldia magna]MSD45887.1 NADH:flavin oxidoreductase [Finegoldia magna]